MRPLDVSVAPRFTAGRRSVIDASITRMLIDDDDEDMRDLLTAHGSEDVAIGHNLKGVGLSYGFDGITAIGTALEEAAQRHDAEATRLQATELARYLRRVRIASS